METLAIIPARGGSKGLPRKNLLPVGGKPLVAHSIAHALATPEISRVIVSTDDPAIAEAARAAGAEVVRRPAELSTDTATSESALRHVLDELGRIEGYRPDLVAFLQPTSPIRKPDDLSRAIAILQEEGADSLFAARPNEQYIWRVEGLEVRSLSYDYRHRLRRQDAPEDLAENGSFYFFKPWVLLETGNRLGGKIAVHRMGYRESFQVDTAEDLALIERLMTAEPQASPTATAADAVRLLVFDFDGVMTDNRVWTDQDGRESVACYRGDGLGLARVKRAGIRVLVLSTEKNPVVSARCRKLGLECVQGSDNKLAALVRYCGVHGFRAADVAYVGNDINDLECLRWVGLPVAVADAEAEALAAARWATTRRGGYGAVREVCDAIAARRAATPDADQ